MARIALVAPCFEPTFFGYDYMLPIFGKQARFPVAALTHLAGLTPHEHDVLLIDEALSPLDFDEIAKADIVGLTGMVVQRERMLSIARELKARGAFLVIGGPWITAREDYFDGFADVKFIGEADATWPQFLAEWADGTHAERYEQNARTDMTTLPPPRFDLIDLSRFVAPSIQVSRGCPFRCEFCDIIVMFGRVPRVKTPDQVICELELLREQKVPGVFFSDDNFIGNKKLIIPVLEAIIDWRARTGYDMAISTEASLNLAEEHELRQLMIKAGFRSVFIGIEAVSEAALKETKKVQNLKQRNSAAELSLADDVHRRVAVIQDSGLHVMCGTIVGFDSDFPDVFEQQRKFFAQSAIPIALVGMLSAIPGTPLYDRLEAVGRLDNSEPPEYGTNVIPLNLTQKELRDGYTGLMEDLYTPAAFFGRVERHFRALRPSMSRRRTNDVSLRSRLRSRVRGLLFAVKIVLGISRQPHGRRGSLTYLGRLITFMLLRGGRSTEIARYAYFCAEHFHFHSLAREFSDDDHVRNSF